MINVIIFGTGSTAEIVLSGLNENVNVIYFSDNNEKKWNTKYNDIKVISPKEIEKLNYKYIIIASQFEADIFEQLVESGISRGKIFQFYKYNDYYSGENYIKLDIKRFYDERKEVESIVTGISYSERGIREDLLKRKTRKFTRHSQDIYFDYNLVNYVLNNYKKDLINLKYCIIGLSYYSFEYDMSKSAMKEKVGIYYEAIGKKHNFENISSYSEEKDRYKIIAKELFNVSNDRDTLKVTWNNASNASNLNYKIGQEQAIIDGKKNYPKTVKENIGIFKKYLRLLEENDIKPIVIVCPVSKYYSEYFSKKLKEKFYEVINVINDEYNFQFLDYFYDKTFNDEDFYDVSHLNDNGAEKFTKLLNKDIKW